MNARVLSAPDTAMSVRPAPTREIRLEPMGVEHLEATCRWLGDADLRRQIDSGGGPPTPDGNAAYWRANWANPARRDFAIVDAGGEHLGNCGLVGVDLHRRKAELWIYLGGGYGGGVGSAAVRQLLAHAFGDLGLHRVFLRVVSDNPRAVGFYQRLGFVVEGRTREDSRRGDAFVDSIWLGMLESEHTASSAQGPFGSRS